MLVQTIRKNAAKQGAPYIIVFAAWAARNGRPLVTWALSSRTPTRPELIEAIVAAGFTQEVAVVAAERELKKSNNKPANPAA
jgi:hypothetical protein